MSGENNDQTSSADEFCDLLRRAQAGDSQAVDALSTAVNTELRMMASKLVRGRYGIAQPTSLVNDLYLKLFGGQFKHDLINRKYFFTVARNEMSRMVRARIRKKRGAAEFGDRERLPIDIVLDSYAMEVRESTGYEFDAISDALEALKARGGIVARQCEAIELHYLNGLKQAEVAEMLGVGVRQIDRDLKAGRARLAVQLEQT